MNKINLEELLINNFLEEESVYSYDSLNGVTKACIKKSMLEFGKMLLESAFDIIKERKQ